MFPGRKFTATECHTYCSAQKGRTVQIQNEAENNKLLWHLNYHKTSDKDMDYAWIGKVLLILLFLGDKSQLSQKLCCYYEYVLFSVKTTKPC